VVEFNSKSAELAGVVVPRPIDVPLENSGELTTERSPLNCVKYPDVPEPVIPVPPLISLAVSVLNVGVALDPDEGPAKNVLEGWVVSVTLNVPEPVILDGLTLRNEGTDNPSVLLAPVYGDQLEPVHR
jgi:hypothetical protein